MLPPHNLEKTCHIISVDIGLTTLRIAYRIGNEEAKPLHLDECQSVNAVSSYIPVLIKNDLIRSGVHEVEIGQMALRQFTCFSNHSLAEHVLYLLKVYKYSIPLLHHFISTLHDVIE